MEGKYIPKQWLHIGSAELKAELFNEVQNELGMVKPRGGLWASPLHERGEHLSPWQRCAKNMGFKVDGEGCIFELTSDARVYIIDTLADLIQLLDEFEAPPLLDLPFLPKTIDFEAVRHVYDVLYLTENGQYATRLPLQNRDYNLYGWDCESCIILNFDAIGQQEPIDVHTFQKTRGEAVYD